MILLDTDHITILLFENHPQFDALSKGLLAAADQDIGSTVISLEERPRADLSSTHPAGRVL